MMQKDLELAFFRAKRDGKGIMAIAQLRGQNAFLQTGAQAGPMLPQGGADFELKDPKRSITVKLGVPDLSGFLVAYRNVRLAGLAVPVKLQAYSTDKSRDNSMSLGMVHKYKEQSKVLTWAFTEEGSFLGLSNGPFRQSVALSPADEVAFALFCEQALVRLMERVPFVHPAG